MICLRLIEETDDCIEEMLLLNGSGTEDVQQHTLNLISLTNESTERSNENRCFDEMLMMRSIIRY